MPRSNNKAEVFFNKANVALARSEKLVKSWLPPEENGNHATSASELPQLDSEEFAVAPEQLGLGATLPKDSQAGPLTSTSLALPEKVRKSLLGKNAKKAQYGSGPRVQNTKENVRKRPLDATQHEEDVSEEEESRTSAINARRPDPKGASRPAINPGAPSLVSSSSTQAANERSPDGPEERQGQVNAGARLLPNTQPSVPSYVRTPSNKRIRVPSKRKRDLKRKKRKRQRNRI